MFATLTTTFENMKTIQTDRCQLEFLTNDTDAKAILSLKQINLRNDYIKPMYICSPNDVTKKTIELLHNFRINKNREIDKQFDHISFKSLYYVIRLKENGRIIGSLEICDSISENSAIGFGLFIDQKYSSQGLGTEVLIAIINFLRQYCTIRKLRWDCYRNNARSISMAKKCGFIHDRNWLMERSTEISTFYLLI